MRRAGAGCCFFLFAWNLDTGPWAANLQGHAFSYDGPFLAPKVAGDIENGHKGDVGRKAVLVFVLIAMTTFLNEPGGHGQRPVRHGWEG